MTRLLKRLNISVKAYFLKYFRTRQILKVYKAAHAEELRSRPVIEWPQLQALHSVQIDQIKKGKLVAGNPILAQQGGIVDRRSWVYPWLPQTVTRMAVPIAKMCYDDKTEVLTRRGWILWPEVRDDDEFLTREHNGNLVYEKSDGIIRKPYKGEMIHFDSHYIDIKVTPEHRMYGRYRGKRLDDILTKKDGPFTFSTMRFSPAKRVAQYEKDHPELQSRFCIPTDGVWKGNWPKDANPKTKKIILTCQYDYGYEAYERKYTVDLKDWVAFLAIFIAEGSVKGTLNGFDLESDSEEPHFIQAKKLDGIESYKFSGYLVRIAQRSGSESYDQIDALLQRLGFNYSKDAKGFSFYDKTIHSYLVGLGHTYSKYVPDWIKQLPTELLEVFFDWACIGDGHHYDCGTRAYWTVSKQLADDMLEILIKMGKDAQLTCKKQSGSKKWNLEAARQAPLYCVKEHGFYRTGTLYPNCKSLIRSEEVFYDGLVYCCTVPSGVIMTRRRGKIAWCGQSPYNLRRMARTPVPRRAINLVKGALISQPWDILKLGNIELDQEMETSVDGRIAIAKKCFHHPNNDDSFQTWLEQGIEDLCILGAFVAELRLTPDPKRPIKSWTVNVESIRTFAGWSEAVSKEYPRYAQMTGLKGERGAILFYNDQLIYIKDNPATDNPFGTGRMEVAFQHINYLLGIQDMSGKAGSDAIHKTWLWWEQPQSEQAYQIVRRHIQNELEGQAKVSIIGGMKKPEVIEINPVQEPDLLLNWQEMLIRMVANAFDLSPLALGIERDVNRSVGTVLDDKDFRTAIVPLARRLQEAFTRKILHEKLGWYDLEFKFLSLDDPDIETKINMYQRGYGMNAVTPNEFRKAMGWEESDSPFANLTQFEAMIVNLQASADIQLDQQSKMMDKQNQMQQDQMAQQAALMGPEMYQGFPAGGNSYSDQGQKPQQGNKPPALAPGKVETVGGTPKQAQQPRPPKPLKLPGFPVGGGTSGKSVTASDIAAMTVAQLHAAFENGDLPSATDTVSYIDNQDPAILEQLSDEVRSYLEQKLEEEQEAKRIKKPSAKWLKEWKKKQLQRSNKDNKREQDMARWIQKYGSTGKPGGTANTYYERMMKKAGKPGDINPIRKG